MQEIIAIQQCRSLDGWIPVQVESQSEPGIYHVVMVNAWGPPSETICDCDGYRYRHYCSHQRKAVLSLCRWEENAVSEPQSEEQKDKMVCPRCGGSTKFDVRVVNG